MPAVWKKLGVIEPERFVPRPIEFGEHFALLEVKEIKFLRTGEQHALSRGIRRHFVNQARAEVPSREDILPPERVCRPKLQIAGLLGNEKMPVVRQKERLQFAPRSANRSGSQVHLAQLR